MIQNANVLKHRGERDEQAVTNSINLQLSVLGSSYKRRGDYEQD